MNNEIIEAKIKKYDSFIEEKLKNDLKIVDETLRTKNRMYEEWEEVEDMSKTIKDFNEKNEDIYIKFELAAGVMVQGEINEYNNVYVDIGLGYILEMEPDEAIKYAKIRKNILRKQVEHYQNMAIDIKVHIKYALLAISELHSTIVKSS